MTAGAGDTCPATVVLTLLLVVCRVHAHYPGPSDPAADASDHFHEKVSMEQAKIRLEQLRTGKLMENEAHIRHHLENIAQIPEKEMTEEQRSFHFFYIHDMDQNNKLDGLEILHSIMENHKDEVDLEGAGGKKGGDHESEEDRARKEDPDHPANWSWEELVQHIDSILQDYDRDGDGYINFYEFKRIVDQYADEDAAKSASNDTKSEKKEAADANKEL